MWNKDHICLCARVCVLVDVCVCVCVSVCVYVSVRTCLDSCVCTSMPQHSICTANSPALSILTCGCQSALEQGKAVGLLSPAEGWVR